jgi:hypothetical protein
MMYIIFEGYPVRNPTGLLDIFTGFFMFVIYLRWLDSVLKLATAEYLQSRLYRAWHGNLKENCTIK